MAGNDAARGLSQRLPIALTIAGSDSGAGAGIQADLRTFAALGVYGASAITALTAQNTLDVAAIHYAPPEIVAAQIGAVLSDFDVAAIKIGMLGNVEIAEAVARALLPLRGLANAKHSRGVAGEAGPMRGCADRDPSSVAPSERHPPRMPRIRSVPQGEKRSAPFIVYDPVMIASSGDALSSAGFIEAIKAKLLPLVDCLTPNLAEAAALLGEPIARDEAGMARQGRALLALGPRAVLMKGGHLDGAEAVDLLVTADTVRRFAAPRLASRNLHGTGCTLASAIAAHTVLGAELGEAVGAAKEFVRQAIEAGTGVTLGAGAGPLMQFGLPYRAH